MARAKAGAPEEIPGAMLDGRGRKSREHNDGASSVTVTRENSSAEAGTRLMEEIVSRANMHKAYNRVVSNKGAPGVDKMSTGQTEGLFTNIGRASKKYCWRELLTSTGAEGRNTKAGRGHADAGNSHRPRPSHSAGSASGTRAAFEPGFSASSYGFRPGKSAHQAVQAARKAVSEGLRWVVDIDLAKFFDRVNHDILMSRVARKVKDKRVLHLIRSYVPPGLFEGGIISPRREERHRRAVISPAVQHPS